MLRTLMAKLSLTAVAIALSITANAIANPPANIDIPAGELIEALKSLSTQSDIELVYQPEQLRELRTPGVKGTYTPREAIDILLKGTPLRVHAAPNGAMVIAPPAPPAKASGEALRGPTPTASAQDSGRIRLAQETATDESGTSSDTTELKKLSLEEIIVTAQKREERLQDVPVPVTAIEADILVNSNQLRIQEYYTRMPGLSITTGDFHGAPQLAVRGVTTGGFSTPTVGIVVDDLPYGSTLGVTLGQEAPDLDPSELTRIELLRGPQGTLYGASSMGGLLKLVTVDPSTDRLSGRVQVGTSSIENGDGLGHSVRGTVNVPLGDSFAVRASGFTRRDPGYVDNPTTGVEGINRTDVDGGRVSALWRPSESFSVKLGAMRQHLVAEGSSEVHVLPGLGDLQQTALRGTGVFDKHVEVYSGTVTAKLREVELVAISGYNVSEFEDAIDYTRFRGANAFNLYGVTGAALLNHFETSKFTQEVRLSAPVGESFEWLVGGFYNREKTLPRQQNAVAIDPASGSIVGPLFFDTTPNTFTEYAAFANLTFHLTERFDVQIGGRHSEDKQESYQFRDVIGGNDIFVPNVETDEDAFTYLLTPRLKISPDLMLYARLASGYRPGGPNPNALALGLPQTFKPDETQNYEIGLKGSVWDGALSFDTSIYYIDWKDMQLQLIAPSGLGYFANAGRAKSEGVELSVESHPLQGMTIAGWVSLSDAVLAEAFPPTATVRGADGDRLPVSSRFSGSLSVQQEFALASSESTVFVGASVSYVGDRKGIFTGGTTPRQEFPAYTRTDLSAGMRYGLWSLNVFVNNVADKRAVLNGGIGSLHPTAFTYIQPRTAGLSVAKTF